VEFVFVMFIGFEDCARLCAVVFISSDFDSIPANVIVVV